MSSRCLSLMHSIDMHFSCKRLSYVIGSNMIMAKLYFHFQCLVSQLSCRCLSVCLILPKFLCCWQFFVVQVVYPCHRQRRHFSIPGRSHPCHRKRNTRIRQLLRSAIEMSCPLYWWSRQWSRCHHPRIELTAALEIRVYNRDWVEEGTAMANSKM